jgi:2-C-methyl-D-erythritol 4-phosphate cytidylyltransferase
MQRDIPKQFLMLGGRPLLMHTIERFHHAGIPIVLVLPESFLMHWKSLCEQYGFSLPHRVVSGGDTRSASVRKGLAALDKEEALVAVHDGARPLIRQELIERAFVMASEKGNAVMAVPTKDSIRFGTPDSSKAMDRTKVFQIQTPQVFSYSALSRAFASLSPDQSFTDEASLMESQGEAIFLCEGDYRNLKITTPEDLILAEALLQG